MKFKRLYVAWLVCLGSLVFALPVHAKAASDVSYQVYDSNTDGFSTVDGKTVYYAPDGAMVHGERNIGGSWYHFDELSGEMSTGLTTIPAGGGSKTVLYGEDGAMLYGLQQVGGLGERYFDTVTGSLRTGWQDISGVKCYIQPDGSYASGELAYAGKWYYLDPESHGMAKGLRSVPTSGGSSKTVYYAPDGAMVHGERNIGGSWYHFDELSGEMSTGLTTIPAGGGSKTVLYGEDGAMLYGLQQVGGLGERYFDTVTGSLKVNCWVNTGMVYRYCDCGGVLCAYLSINNNGEKILINPDGSVASGWIKSSNSTFYAVPSSGKMAVGEIEIEGKWYLFNANGVMQTGFYYLGDSAHGKWVYYNSDGSMSHGEACITGSWYYFDDVTGAVTYGWKYIASGSKLVWYGPVNGDGKMRYGWQFIDGSKRFFNTESGALEPYRSFELVKQSGLSQLGCTNGSIYEDQLLRSGGNLCWGSRGNWCATFVWWCFNSSGCSSLLTGGRPISDPQGIAQWYQNRGRYSSSLNGVKPGDIVFFQYTNNFTGQYISHATLCIGGSVNTVTVLEGNPYVGINTYSRSNPHLRGYASLDYMF